MGPPGRDGVGISTDAWTTFTPTWTGSVSDPAIGDGTLQAAYILLGKICHYRLDMVAGSTTTFGSGNWSFGLPVGVTAKTGARQTMIAMAQDIGTAMNAGLCFLSSGVSSYLVGAITGGSLWASNVPHTWANTDIIRVNGTFEVN